MKCLDIYIWFISCNFKSYTDDQHINLLFLTYHEYLPDFLPLNFDTFNEINIVEQETPALKRKYRVINQVEDSGNTYLNPNRKQCRNQ